MKQDPGGDKPASAAGEPKQSKTEKAAVALKLKRGALKAHPFFWVLLLATLASMFPALLVHGRTPAYALESVAIYRLEVALVFFAGLYGFTALLWLAYYGESVRKASFPGGSVEAESIRNAGKKPIEQAADSIESFRDNFEQRLGKIEETIEAMSKEV